MLSDGSQVRPKRQRAREGRCSAYPGDYALTHGAGRCPKRKTARPRASKPLGSGARLLTFVELGNHAKCCSGALGCPAPSMRMCYNSWRTVPRTPGQHLFSYRKPGCSLKYIPAAFLSKAVRHSLLAKLTIPITTVRSAHTAMIVWVSIGFSDLSKLPRATKHRAHCSAPRRRASQERGIAEAASAPAMRRRGR